MVRTTLLDFMTEDQKQQSSDNMNEILYFSNHETAWRRACEIAGVDPEGLMNKKFGKAKNRGRK